MAEDQIDVFNIKRKIKQSLKKHFVPPETTIDMFKYGRVLGKGAYGKVNVCVQKLSSKLCAVKSINLEKVKVEDAKKKIESEKNILMKLRHPNIVQLYEHIRDFKLGYDLIYMELCTGGDLLGYLRRRKRLEEPITKMFMKQLMQALGYLHAKGVIHRDIKLENILLSNLGQIKVCDFGVSKQLKPQVKVEKKPVERKPSELINKSLPSEPGELLDPKETEASKNGDQEVSQAADSIAQNETIEKEERFKKVMKCCGTPAYMAPEVIEAGQQQRNYEKLKKKSTSKRKLKKPSKEEFGYGTACDIWSAGILLYALVYGQLPFRGVTVREIKEKIINKRVMMLKDGISADCQDLLRHMLDRDPKKRYTVEQILEHRWLKDAPQQKDITVFNESERASMIKEFFFSENPDRWHEFIEVPDKECKDLLRFSDGFLRTQESAKFEKNDSEGSTILAPQNSLLKEDEMNKPFKLEKGHTTQLTSNSKELINSSDVYLRLKKMARQADQKYELEHNDNVDNGVYKTGNV